MGTYVFSGGNGTTGFSMLDWSAADILIVIASTLSSSHSSSQVTYTIDGETLVAGGSLGGYNSFGDPTTGTVTSFTYTTDRFGAPSMTVSGSAFSLSVSTLFSYLNNGDWLSLHHFLFGGADSMTGSAGGDILEGYGGGDIINGGAGDDALFGENYPGFDSLSLIAGNDTLTGGEGDDAVFGQGGNDTLSGGNGRDLLAGGVGDDQLDGGADYDAVSYFDATSGVTVSLAITGQQNTIGAGLDTLINIEDILGSAFNDTLTGDANANIITGAEGDDILNGGDGVDTVSYIGAAAGVTVLLSTTAQQDTGADGRDTLSGFENIFGSDHNDTLGGNGGNNLLDGGLGADIATYTAALAGVSVSLLISGQQDTVGAGLDTLIGIEGLAGSAFNDTLIGTSADNTLIGGDGDDHLSAGLGNDVITGGAGVDVANFADAIAAVTLNLSNTAQQDTGAGLDTVSGVENVIGSAFNDVLTGDAANNVLTGAIGADTLEGGLGADTLDGGDGADIASYAGATGNVAVSLALAGQQDTLGAGIDTLIGIEHLTGGGFNDTLIGDAGANNLLGGNGNDTLEGGLGNDRLDGGAGFDTVSFATASSGVIVYIGTTNAWDTGQGLDTILNAEAIIGSAFDDQLYGNDLINNTLSGGAGNDLLHGAYGNDLLDGGDGVDTVTYVGSLTGITASLAITGAQSAAGFDTFVSIENLSGGDYADTLTGNAGDNVLFGDSGDDTLVGGGGNDVLNGAHGLDTVSYAGLASGVTLSLAITTQQDVGAGAGLDTFIQIERIIGTSHNDNLTGGGGADVLIGGDGDDIIDGGSGGDDRLDGGAGIDTISFATATAGVMIHLEYVTPINTIGAGYDELRNFENIIGSAFNDTIYGGRIADGGAGNDLIFCGVFVTMIVGGDGIDTVSFDTLGGHNTASLAIAGPQSVNAWYVNARPTFVGVENLTGGIGDDVLTGNDGANVLIGANNLDVLTGGGGDDTLDGGNHSDTLLGQDGNDSLYAGDDDDLLIGGAGNDFYHGAAGVDTASFAQTGNAVSVDLRITTAQDTGEGLDRFSGIENLIGTPYDDVLIGDASANTFDGGAGADTIDGGEGIDTVSYASATNGVVISLALAGPQANGDVLSNIERLIGSAYDDTLIGDANDNTLIGGLGNDVLNGGAGVDTASYENASAGVVVSLAGPNGGVAGNDTFVDIEILLGSRFNDTLTGDAGDNTLSGGDGGDTLYGGAGNDVLLGGRGQNHLDGGAGDDFFTPFEFAQDSATHQVHGGDGVDTISFEVTTQAITFSVAHTSGGQSLGGGQGAIWATGLENVIGSRGRNVLTGDAGANILTGADDIDRLTGGGGSDTLWGRGGADQLFGGDGDDFLAGGAGADALDGGVGGDTASYANSSTGVSIDLITGLISGGDAAGDTLTGIENLEGSAFNDTLTGGGGANVLSGNAGADTLTGNDGDDTLNGGQDADVLYGRAGLDVLDGGEGADAMYGGGGDDTYHVDHISDVVGENSASGADTIIASVSFGLGAYIENLALTGVAAINGVGNILANAITGNGGANTLSGLAGADTLSGGGGEDILNGGNGADTLNGGDDDDLIDGGNDGDALNGGEGADTLYGRTANDTLNGDAGADTIFGGDGDDTANGGDGDDVIDGNNHDDTLFGGAGADEMYGRQNNDTLNGDEGADALYGGDGDDALNGGGDDDLLDGGNGIDVLSGGDGADTLYGRNGVDVLDGGLGADTLIGGNGADTFVFSTELGAGNVDAILFYSVADDTILLHADIFAAIGIGALAANAFTIGAAAADSDDRIIYNASTGALYYDADGDGVGAAVQFATIGAGIALTAADFLVGP